MVGETALSEKYAAYPEHKDSGIDWIGETPAHWLVKPLFSVAATESIKNTSGQKTNVLSLSYGNIIPRDVETNFGLLPASFNTYQLVSPGDLVLRLTDLQNDKRSLRVGHAKQSGIITSAYLKLTARNTEIDNRYFYLLLHSYDTTKVFYGMGGGLRQSMTFEEMRRLPILIPTLQEQREIADFLDHETAKIDTLIDKQQQLIQLLKEKRQAVISHAVTKGLNPNAPMRDSGVEWLGEVPEHWGVKKFKFLCKRIIAGPFGSSITKDMYVKKGFKVYGQEQVIPNNFYVGDYYISEKDYLALSRYIVGEGDVLISCVGTFGKIAVFPKGAEPGIINPRLIKAEINKEHNPYYVRELLKSEMIFKQFELLSRGGTMGVINIAILSEILTAVPPASEQQKIVEFINLNKQKFSNLIERANIAVQLLQERRTALISAAVTGKIDVRHPVCHPTGDL